MASSSVASARRHVSAPRKSAKQATKVHTLTPDSIPPVIAEGREFVARSEGKDPVAIAVGDHSRARVEASEGSYMGCAIATGSCCTAEVDGEHSGVIAAVAVGIGSNAISTVKGVESIAIGHGNYAEAPDGGTAISIGCDPTAQAGEGGYLVFVDITGDKPAAAVFAVDPDKGIWPDVPYGWSAGWSFLP